MIPDNRTSEMNIQHIDRILLLSRSRRATPEDKGFIAEMNRLYDSGYPLCINCPNSIREGFSRIVGLAHKAKAQLDAQLEQEIKAIVEKQISDAEENIRQTETTLDLTLEADCVHCLYQTDINSLSKAQRARLINEVGQKVGVVIKNCLECTDELIRVQIILRDYFANLLQ